jgi:potassium-transporting ATPase KdpC subunit
MIHQFRPALVLFTALSLLTGLLYPLAMTGVANVLFPRQAQGSLVSLRGRPVGSALIGQNFTDARDFHPRPSATSGPDAADPSKTVPSPYNGAASSASNLGPTAQALIERVGTQVAALKAENPDAIREGLAIPADLVTMSGSGLDPDLSPAAALFQVPRIARARHLPEERVRALVLGRIHTPLMGWLGEPHVNVLDLNLALNTLR